MFYLCDLNQGSPLKQLETPESYFKQTDIEKCETDILFYGL